MTALLLLAPGTPMLFQGQEFAASAPFLYFADFDPELAAPVRKGRAEFLRAVSERRASERRRAGWPIPADPRHLRALQARFRASARRTRAIYALHRDLLRLRRDRRGVSRAARRRRRRQRARRRPRSRSASSRPTDTDDRAADRQSRRAISCRDRSPSRCWRRRADATGPSRWSSEDAEYGGGGTPDALAGRRLAIPGECAVVLATGRRPVARAHASVRRRTALTES